MHKPGLRQRALKGDLLSGDREPTGGRSTVAALLCPWAPVARTAAGRSSADNLIPVRCHQDLARFDGLEQFFPKIERNQHGSRGRRDTCCQPGPAGPVVSLKDQLGLLHPVHTEQPVLDRLEVDPLAADPHLVGSPRQPDQPDLTCDLARRTVLVRRHPL